MRILALILLVAAVGAAVVSWSDRRNLGMPALGPKMVVGPHDVRRVRGDLYDRTLHAPGFDAYEAMRPGDGRLWLGLAIGLALAAAAAGVAEIFRGARRVLLALGVVMVVAAAVSSANHDHMTVRFWSVYTARSSEQVDRQLAGVHLTAYDGMKWDDARLWLGVALGLGAGGLAMSGVVLWRRGS
jgi:hypothetical protein